MLYFPLIPVPPTPAAAAATMMATRHQESKGRTRLLLLSIKFTSLGGIIYILTHYTNDLPLVLQHWLEVRNKQTKRRK